MPYIQIQKQYSQTVRKLNVVNSFNRAYHTLTIFFTCIYYFKKKYKKTTKTILKYSLKHENVCVVCLYLNLIYACEY